MSASDFGGLFPLKFWGRKTQFSTTPFCDFIANISRLEQDFVDWKTALQTAITPLRIHWSSRPSGAFNKSYTQKKHRYTKCLEESEQTFYAVGPRAYSLVQTSNPYCDGFSPLIEPPHI